MLVRKMAYKLGFRFRLHRKDLPGKPDLVFLSRRKVIFVHGCFWHQHPDPNCRDARMPRSNLEYWAPKLAGNVERDNGHIQRLGQIGWGTLVIWECETKDSGELARKLHAFLDNEPSAERVDEVKQSGGRFVG